MDERVKLRGSENPNLGDYVGMGIGIIGATAIGLGLIYYVGRPLYEVLEKIVN